MDEVKSEFSKILEKELFSIDKYSLSVYEVLAALLVLIIGIAISKLVKKLIYRSNRFDVGKKFAISQMLHYIILIIVFFIMLKTLGVDISPLWFGSSALLVGLGLGLQNLFLDFISGVIILVDRSVKVGDVVDIDGIVGRVTEIKMRTTEIRTRENKSIIFPNSILTKNKLINFSHSDNVVRFDISVGVAYNTDINLAERLMIEAAKEHSQVLSNRDPIVRLENFGDSSLDLNLYFFSRDLFKAPQIKSDVRRAVLDKFRAHHINIPFPIRTLQFPQEYYDQNK